MLFGLAPALKATGLSLHRPLHEERRGATGGRAARRVRAALVTVEVALAVVLVVGAGLLLHRLLRVDPGFRPENVLTARLTLSATRYLEDRQAAGVYAGILERLGKVPGVLGAATVNVPPLQGFGGDTVFDIEGRPPARDQGQQGVLFQHLGFRTVSPGYFETLGISLLSGRTFGDVDGAEAKRVTIVNETMARRFWPEQDPIGQRIRLYRNPTETGPWMEVVGVVRDTRIRRLDEEAKQEIFVPASQSPGRTTTLVVRTAGDPLGLAGTVRDQVRAVDPEVPVFGVSTMEHILESTVVQPRLNVTILGTFAVLALVLSMVGVYGVVAYGVSQRTREIGVRMALGARGADVIGLVVGQAMPVTGLGLALGLMGAAAVTRWMQTLLYGVTPTDPATFAAVALVLAAVSLGACYGPARRATRVDPVVALHDE